MTPVTPHGLDRRLAVEADQGRNKRRDGGLGVVPPNPPSPQSQVSTPKTAPDHTAASGGQRGTDWPAPRGKRVGGANRFPEHGTSPLVLKRADCESRGGRKRIAKAITQGTADNWLRPSFRADDHTTPEPNGVIHRCTASPVGGGMPPTSDSLKAVRGGASRPTGVRLLPDSHSGPSRERYSRLTRGFGHAPRPSPEGG